MDVYMYSAALYCEPCTNKIRNSLNAPYSLDDESTWDSDDYPKGPYPDGGGEADRPQCCGDCGEFLENPLTGDGRRYVVEALESFVTGANYSESVMTRWLEFYYDGYLAEDLGEVVKRTSVYTDCVEGDFKSVMSVLIRLRVADMAEALFKHYPKESS